MTDWPDLARRFEVVYTAALTDVLDGIGLEHQTLPAEIAPLAPGMRLAGPAFAVEGRPHPGNPYEPSSGASSRCSAPCRPATWPSTRRTTGAAPCSGSSRPSRSVRAGRSESSLEGGTRDVDFIVREGFPVFCRHATPQDSVPRWDCVAWGHEVEIGGVRVTTGDYVVGEADGVVVIPAARVEEVLSRAESVVGTENAVRDAVRQGLAPLEAYERFGKF